MSLIKKLLKNFFIENMPIFVSSVHDFGTSYS